MFFFYLKSESESLRCFNVFTCNCSHSVVQRTCHFCKDSMHIHWSWTRSTDHCILENSYMYTWTDYRQLFDTRRWHYTDSVDMADRKCDKINSFFQLNRISGLDIGSHVNCNFTVYAIVSIWTLALDATWRRLDTCSTITAISGVLRAEK